MFVVQRSDLRGQLEFYRERALSQPDRKVAVATFRMVRYVGNLVWVPARDLSSASFAESVVHQRRLEVRDPLQASAGLSSRPPN